MLDLYLALPVPFPLLFPSNFFPLPNAVHKSAKKELDVRRRVVFPQPFLLRFVRNRSFVCPPSLHRVSRLEILFHIFTVPVTGIESLNRDDALYTCIVRSKGLTKTCLRYVFISVKSKHRQNTFTNLVRERERELLE